MASLALLHLYEEVGSLGCTAFPDRQAALGWLAARPYLHTGCTVRIWMVDLVGGRLLFGGDSHVLVAGSPAEPPALTALCNLRLLDELADHESEQVRCERVVDGPAHFSDVPIEQGQRLIQFRIRLEFARFWVQVIGTSDVLEDRTPWRNLLPLALHRVLRGIDPVYCSLSRLRQDRVHNRLVNTVSSDPYQSLAELCQAWQDTDAGQSTGRGLLLEAKNLLEEKNLPVAELPHRGANTVVGMVRDDVKLPAKLWRVLHKMQTPTLYLPTLVTMLVSLPVPLAAWCRWRQAASGKRRGDMFKFLKKLHYGARVFLARKGGEAETIDVNGRPTVIMHGGDGEPFVYLHSTVGETFLWLPFYQSWAKQFTVYAPTHPGFGKSGGFDEIDSIEDMAFHYLELFDALGLEQVNLGGVSLGGWIAAEFAVRWPERVKKLWLSGSPGLWVDEQPLPDLFRFTDGRASSRDRLREMLFHDPKGAMARLIIADQPDEERMLQAYQSMTALARLVWERPWSPKLPKRLHRIQCPVLLLWGDSDRLVPPAYGEAYRQLLPQAELKLIPSCGHLVMFEKEREFVEEVTRFCRS